MTASRRRWSGLLVAVATMVAVTITGSAVTSDGPASLARSSGDDARFVSMTPTRVLDTRTSTGPVAAGESVTATLSGIPADAAAAVVNVTAANATGNGYLTVWNCDGRAPGTSNGNYVGINTVAANVITAIGDNNEICVQAGDASTEIIVDQMGYFAAGSGVETITPSRVLDTRTDNGGTGPVTPGTKTTITMNDLADDAVAAIVNITATGAQGDGYFTAWNCDSDAPDTSNGNYVGVTTIANTAIIELGNASTICVTTGDAAADLLVDVFGYFTDQSGYTPVTPTRALDTRTTTTPVTPGVTTKINLADVPAGDAAIVNITATGATGDGYFTAWNCDGDAPDASNGNYVGVTTIANSAIITTNTDGDICIQTGQNAADILIDTTSYVTTGPGPEPGPTPIPDLGVTWTTGAAADNKGWASVATDGEGVWVAVTPQGSSGLVMRSTDNGQTWITAEAAETRPWLSVAYNDGVWIAVGMNGVMRSTDNGATWTALGAGDGVPSVFVTWSSVANDGNGVWVAVSSSGGHVMRSTDNGTTWAGLVLDGSLRTGEWRRIASGNGAWVAVATDGSERLMRSTDNGATWTAVGADKGVESNSWTSVTSDGAGVWVAVSRDGTERVMRSTDNGATWTALAAPDAEWVDLAYGNGIWVAVAQFDANRAMNSADGGATWTASGPDQGVPTNQWSSVAYGNGRFVAVSFDGTEQVMYSPGDTSNG